MSSAPLVFIIFLLFAFVVAIALTIWYALTLSTRQPSKPVQQRPSAAPEHQPSDAHAFTTPISNDQIRGAKATGVSRRKEDGDAFERFIRSKNDDLEF